MYRETSQVPFRMGNSMSPTGDHITENSNKTEKVRWLMVVPDDPKFQRAPEWAALGCPGWGWDRLCAGRSCEQRGTDFLSRCLGQGWPPRGRRTFVCSRTLAGRPVPESGIHV